LDLEVYSAIRISQSTIKKGGGNNYETILVKLYVVNGHQSACYAIGQEKEAIVHEAWFVHMESAGGWIAVDKGFYGKVKVKEVQGGPGSLRFKRWWLR